MMQKNSWRRWCALLTGLVVLAACAETQFIAHTAKRVSRTAPGVETPSPKFEYKVGDPYQIKDVWYYPEVNYDYDETGIASWYGSKFHGRNTANGEKYDMNALTAAHRTLPLPSFVQVTNLENGRSLTLRVNDRGPFAHGRIIDVSRRAAQLLGFQLKGTARVRVSILARESRAEAARLRGTQLVASDTPIIISSLPTENVTAEALPPPPGASVSPAAAETQTVTPVASIAASGEETETAALKPELGMVTIMPVTDTKVFIQAGAFAYYDNANRVSARLHRLGPVRIYPLLVNGKDLFRVRMGPIDNIAEADRLLEKVIRAGYPNSRIIVE